MSLRPGEILIGGHNWQQYATEVPSGKAKGLKPRDFTKYPRGFYKSMSTVDIKPIPRSEWPNRIADKVKSKSQTSDIMLARKVPCLDQNGRGYCWAHSTTGAVQAMRALMGQPTIGLSAYSVACKIKKFRDEGGWGAESADFIAQYGVVDEAHWPQRAVDRNLDNQTNWDNALLYKIAIQWADLGAAQYDRNLTFDQYATLWLLNFPTVNDYNWWGHSVMGCDLVDGSQQRRRTRNDATGKLMTLEEFELAWGINDPVTAGFACRIRNSWGDSWGQAGFGPLATNKSVPDGGLGLQAVLPS